MKRIHRDERGFLVSWLARTVIVLGLFAVAVFDAGVIAVNFFRLDAIARDTALELADRVDEQSARYRDQRALERFVKERVASEDAKLVWVAADEEAAVMVRLRREAPTLVVKRLDFLRDWGRATATARAHTP